MVKPLGKLTFFRYTFALKVCLDDSFRILQKESQMPKMKSVKGAVKRFKIKKNGTVKRGTAFRSHILTKQDAGTRRDQNAPKVVAKVDEKNIKAMIA